MSETTTSIPTNNQIETSEYVLRIIGILLTIALVIGAFMYFRKNEKTWKRVLIFVLLLIILILETSLTFKNSDETKLNKAHYLISAFITTFVIGYFIYYFIKFIGKPMNTPQQIQLLDTPQNAPNEI